MAPRLPPGPSPRALQARGVDLPCPGAHSLLSRLSARCSLGAPFTRPFPGALPDSWGWTLPAGLSIPPVSWRDPPWQGLPRALCPTSAVQQAALAAHPAHSQAIWLPRHHVAGLPWGPCARSARHPVPPGLLGGQESAPGRRASTGLARSLPGPSPVRAGPPNPTVPAYLGNHQACPGPGTPGLPGLPPA